ncbi:hypothetical protein FRZ67_15465 [Panacibacter ginsenosidivorans]|uniref:DUF4926 domain-containing protein n=1 Tax=Panacibacter ginsenosidivorans TaxID=1813871 RepID=A0A5B8VAY1_9BACT|nr:DUF4926 domain-containing protein [Panacibacter ginsenosidivorans]QEC68637.1 hypothetical protein FRZ67_15465 [Panacibacter ginsenosidivorans]
MKQYQIVELLVDLNPVIKKGMIGVILEIWNNENFEAEFLDYEGFNYTYNGNATFPLNIKDVRLL